MSDGYKIILISYAVVNFYWIKVYHEIAPCNYKKKGDLIYVTL